MKKTVIKNKPDHKDWIERKGRKYGSVTVFSRIINIEEYRYMQGSMGNDAYFKMLKETGDIGTAFHKLMHEINEGRGWDIEIKELPSPLNIMLPPVREEYFSRVKKVLLSEKHFYSDRYMYHGKPDSIYLLDNRKVPDLIDFKTGATPNLKMIRLQLSAYKEMLKENKISTGRRIFWHINRAGKFKEIDLDREFPNSHEADFNMFLRARSLYIYINGYK